jgi:hypothetical protein
MMGRSNANIDGDVTQQRSEPYSSLMKRYGGTGRLYGAGTPLKTRLARSYFEPWHGTRQDKIPRRSIPKAAPCAPE